jgi:DNA-binding response OmpR family regulator
VAETSDVDLLSLCPRYRFGEFLVSPRLRVLLRNGREQALTQRYFDRLVFLIAHRREAAHRREIPAFEAERVKQLCAGTSPR